MGLKFKRLLKAIGLGTGFIVGLFCLIAGIIKTMDWLMTTFGLQVGILAILSAVASSIVYAAISEQEGE